MAITDDATSGAISVLLEHGNTIVTPYDQGEILAILRELLKQPPKSGEPLNESHPLSRRSQATALNLLLETETQNFALQDGLKQ